MNRADVTAQLEHMKRYYEDAIGAQLGTLVHGDDDHNLAVLEAVGYNHRFLDLITIAAQLIDKVPEAIPQPVPEPPKKPSAGAVFLAGLHHSKPKP
jgi:hypothetical protein